MLILSRKAEQEILIGEDIKLTVVRIDGNRVRIGISAPREVPVLRGELAGNRSDDVSAETHLTQRDMAFAHPPTPKRSAKRPVGRLCQESPDRESPTQPSSDQPSKVGVKAPACRSEDEARLFAGTVAADGGQVKLMQCDADDNKRAPLAGFVAAT